MTPTPYLSPDEVCTLVPGMTMTKLSQLRVTGRGPRYRKPTPKTVIYLESDVVEWIEATARTRTSDAD